MGSTDGPAPAINSTKLPNYKLWVQKGLVTEDLAFASIPEWADHVFNNNYALKTLADLEQFIKANEHLPGVPSAAALQQEGYTLQEINKVFMEKIEELTLYTIEQEKKLAAREALVEKLKTQLKALSKK